MASWHGSNPYDEDDDVYTYYAQQQQPLSCYDDCGFDEDEEEAAAMMDQEEAYSCGGSAPAPVPVCPPAPPLHTAAAVPAEDNLARVAAVEAVRREHEDRVDRLRENITQSLAMPAQQQNMPAITPAVIIQGLEALQQTWLNHGLSPVDQAYFMYGQNPDNEIDIVRVNKLRKEYLRDILVVMFELQENAMWDNNDGIRVRVNRVMDAIETLASLMHTLHRAQSVVNPAHDPSMYIDSSLHRFVPQCTEKLTPIQDCIIYLLNSLQRAGLRRHLDRCYKQVVNPQGQTTYAWVEVCTIKSFIYQQCQRYTSFVQFQNIATPGAVSNIEAYLCNCIDPQFEALKKDRYVMSFENSVFLMNEDRVHFYDDGLLPSDIVACNYHPHPFPAEFAELRGCCIKEPEPGTAWDIPTPCYDTIIDYQQWPHEVKVWKWAMLGHMLHNVGAGDNWQVSSYNWGEPNTGKSLECNVVADFYDHNDTGVLGNKTEKIFGASAYHDKLVAIAPELRRDCNLDQGSLQSFICGDYVNVPVKRLTASKVRWVVPMMLAGNFIPGWDDPQGAMARRLIVFLYEHKVRQVDTTLEKRIKAEIPLIIVKAFRIHKAVVEYVGQSSVWEKVPAYLKKTRKAAQAQTDPLRGFLDSDEIDLLPERADTVYCGVKAFRDAYVASFDKNRPKWDKKHFLSVFEDMGLRYERRRLVYPRGANTPPQRMFFIMGLDFHDDCVRMGDVVEQDDDDDAAMM